MTKTDTRKPQSSAPREPRATFTHAQRFKQILERLNNERANEKRLARARKEHVRTVRHLAKEVARHTKIPDLRHLPKRICVLDVETEEINKKEPEKSKLAIAGIKTYRLVDRKYVAQSYRYFLKDKIGELEQFLKYFEGVVIGHNIFEFDYRVLRPLIALDGIIEKTVDTLMFLWEKKGRQRGGLSLASLAEGHLKVRKGDLGKKVGQLWKDGTYERVIKYNAQDCTVTKALWWHLVRGRPVIFVVDGRIRRRIDATVMDVPLLVGTRHSITFQEWERKIAATNCVWKDKSIAYTEIGEIDVSDNSKAMFLKFRCCGRNFIFATNVDRVFSANETIACPNCRNRLPISEALPLRRDKEGNPIRFVHSDLPPGGRLPTDCQLDPKRAREWIQKRAKRYWWNW